MTIQRYPSSHTTGACGINEAHSGEDHESPVEPRTAISPLRDETDRDWNAEWLAEVRRVTKYRITKKLSALAEQFVDDRASLAAMMDGAQDAVMNWTPPK